MRRGRIIQGVSTMTAEEYRSTIEGKTNKYGAKKAMRDGITFDSTIERDRYDYLKSLADLRAITDLEVHPTYRFVGQTGLLLARYSPDFQYRELDGSLVVEDVKGKATIKSTYIRNCKTLWDREGIMVQTVTRSLGEWKSEDAFAVPKAVARELRKRHDHHG